MQKIVNVTSIEYGTVTVDAPENATDAEIEELAMQILNDGNADWGNQETYVEADSDRLPRLVFPRSSIHQLFECDGWRSTKSIDATQPIAVSIDTNEFASMLMEDLENSARHLSEDNEQFYASLDPNDPYCAQKVLMAYTMEQIDYRHIVNTKLGYKTN